MLWPHDPDMRERFRAAVVFDLAVDMVESVPAGTPAEIGEWSLMIRRAPSLEQFGEASKRPFVHGMVAGERLREAIGFQDIERRTMADIDEALAVLLWRTQRLSAKTINNMVWPRYRSVAHLWAAYIHRTRETGVDAFPTSPTGLALFLAVADEYRRRGEVTRSTVKSPATILRAGDAVMTPDAIALPVVDLVFASSK